MKLKWTPLTLPPINLWTVPRQSNMSRFIQHLPCPRCGSKDNLGEYEDHYFCFGCRKTIIKKDLSSIRKRLEPTQLNEVGDISQKITEDIPKHALKWLLSFGITKADTTKYNIGWNDESQFLVLVNTTSYWQARTFGTHSAKYMSQGKKPLLFYGNGDTIICVEDVLSAIKVSKATESVQCTPLLGSTIGPELTQYVLESNKKVFLWLDRDKATQAVKTARDLISRGVDCNVIITEKDPKEYSIGEIIEWLKSKS